MDTSIGLRTLVLNADMMPANMLTLRANRVEDAIVRILNETCYTVATYDRVFSTPGGKHHIPVPSVMARHKYFQRPEFVPHNKKYILLRDGYKCVYCGVPLTEETMTLDHFVPQSRGGQDSWDNLVASCASCNHALGDIPASKKNPSHKPYMPMYSKLVRLRKQYPVYIDHESWRVFLEPWPGGIIVKPNMPK